jgi:hypothetical protein
LRHGGGDISHRRRKRIEELFGWINSRAWQAPTRLQPTTNCPRQCAVGRLGNAPVSKILDPDSDQVAKMSCAFRKTVQRVTGDEFDGKSFRLADEVRHIQRRQPATTGASSPSVSLFCSLPKTGDAWLLDPSDQLAAPFADDFRAQSVSGGPARSDSGAGSRSR